MKRRLWIPAAALLLVAAASAASENDFLSKATSAAERGKPASAHFWLTRHLAQSQFAVDEGSRTIFERLRLEPKGFIPESWPEEVRRWFIESARRQWAVDPSLIHEGERRFEAVSDDDGEYFAKLTVVPEVQLWYRMKEGISTSREVLVAGAAKPAPLLAFGYSTRDASPAQPAAVLPFYSLRPLHHAALVLTDADGDGKKDLVVRLTWFASNGFRQSIRLYRILPQARLEVWKTLEAPPNAFLTLDDQAGPVVVPLEKASEKGLLN